MSPSAMTMPAMPGGFDSSTTSPGYEVRSPTQATSGLSRYFPQMPSAAPQMPTGYTMGDYTDLPPHERPGYVPLHGHVPYPSQSSTHDQDLAYGVPPSPIGDTGRHHSASISSQSQSPYQYRQPEPTQAQPYRYAPQSTAGGSRSSSYSAAPYPTQQPYQYAQPPEKITYTAKPQTKQSAVPYTQSPQGKSHEQVPRSYSQSHSAYAAEAQIVDITPGSDVRSRKSSSSKPHRLSINGPQASLYAPPSPGLGPRMERLSVSGNRPDVHAHGAGGLPPPSPLLEAYHGTYQSLSPMPTAMMLDDDDDLDDLPALSPTTSRSQSNAKLLLEREKEKERERKRVKLYDAEGDALALVDALKHSKIDADVVCDILPKLSHDQMLELRQEYKKHCKIQGKGINLSKHLKLKLTGNFGKAAYVTALGRWESEGYWANFWYQSHGSRRELLIESLMGRSNAEIRQIKESFKDKRYSDSLTKCMEKELKMDKFRTAVLMVLEERRQEEQDVYPIEYRNRDVDLLSKALKSREGGESAMLEIIVRRSDSHLREVLKTYERMNQENFARAALKKSNNLVGEVIAHILNGVINRPARDALLLRHAIKDIAEHNKDDELRYELLISRLVRLHWDRLHLSRVKREYSEKYRKELEEDIEDATKGDFREFMCELCQTK